MSNAACTVTRSGWVRFAAASVALVAVAGAAEAGIVTLDSQTHSISVSPGGGAPEDMVNSSGNDPFNETLTRGVNSSTYNATATGRLDAGFDSNTFSFDGGMSYAATNAAGGDEFVSGPTSTISAQFVFSIDSVFNYELRSVTNLINADAGALDEGDDQFFGDGIQQEGERADGTQFGILQPGTYTFNLNRRVTSFSINPGETRDFETEFDRSLHLSPVDDGGGGPGPGPNPIPLPPAVLAAGSVLGAMGLVRGGKRLRRRQ